MTISEDKMISVMDPHGGYDPVTISEDNTISVTDRHPEETALCQMNSHTDRWMSYVVLR